MNRLFAICVCSAAALAIACSQQAATPTQPSASTAVGAGASSTLQSRGGIASYLPVTTTIVDSASYDIGSDSGNNGSYTNTAPVVSYLTANGYNGIPYGDWQFQTYGSTRTVRHSFGSPILPLVNPNLVPAAGNYSTRMQVECTLVGSDMLTMTVNQQLTNCGMLTDLEVASTTPNYGEQMAPTFTGFGETTNVLITCNAVGTPANEPTGCTNWYIDPLSTGTEARLMHAETVKNKTVKIEVGDFNMHFHFEIQR